MARDCRAPARPVRCSARQRFTREHRTWLTPAGTRSARALYARALNASSPLRRSSPTASASQNTPFPSYADREHFLLLRKLKKDISFALRRGTIAQVTTLALDAAQRAAEAELTVNEVGLAW